VTGQTLYIFPHAGGSARFYVPFAKTFTTDVRRVAVQYPGKGGAHDISAFTSISDLADEVCRKLPPMDGASGKVAFFGHSMGALVAFEVARRFEETGRGIGALFVSACAAPGRSGYDYIPESDRGLLDAVTEMTGVNPEYLDNEFAAKILPTLRGFKAITKYDCPPEATVSCPIVAFYADGDEVATRERVAPWAQRTTSEFVIREFAGHHFYLTDHLPEVVGEIEKGMAARMRG
jgi:surfactin synthase thioesterase subunit